MVFNSPTKFFSLLFKQQPASCAGFPAIDTIEGYINIEIKKLFVKGKGANLQKKVENHRKNLTFPKKILNYFHLAKSKRS